MLNVDKFFYEALLDSEGVVELLDERIYNPDRTIEQEEEDVLPYVVIAYENGGSQGGDSKDDVFVGLDSAVVSVQMVSENRDALADLSEAVLGAVKAGFDDDLQGSEDWSFVITGCRVQAGPVQYDPVKPCCFQTLTFSCDTDIR